MVCTFILWEFIASYGSLWIPSAAWADWGTTFRARFQNRKWRLCSSKVGMSDEAGLAAQLICTAPLVVSEILACLQCIWQHAKINGAGDKGLWWWLIPSAQFSSLFWNNAGWPGWTVFWMVFQCFHVLFWDFVDDIWIYLLNSQICSILVIYIYIYCVYILNYIYIYIYYFTWFLYVSLLKSSMTVWSESWQAECLPWGSTFAMSWIMCYRDPQS